MIYHVWYADGTYWGSLSDAADIESAVVMAKKLGVQSPMIQDEQSFVSAHVINERTTLEHVLNRQQLRYADIKSAEQRTWRDRAY
jgi:hypothetical protein